MMSNKSAQYPQGYLDKETFKSFFAVSGEPGSFTYKQGYERIPDNWYKRAVGDEYTIPEYVIFSLGVYLMLFIPNLPPFSFASRLPSTAFSHVTSLLSPSIYPSSCLRGEDTPPSSSSLTSPISLHNPSHLPLYLPPQSLFPNNRPSLPTHLPHSTHSLTFFNSFLLDVLQFARQDPRLLSIGGNTGTPNSFTGISITDFTNSVYNGATLAQGNNLQCFTFQLVQAEAPGLLTGVYEDVTKALGKLNGVIGRDLEGLGCPQLEGVDESLYQGYPGYLKAKGAKK